MAQFHHLPNELITKIYKFCPDIESVLSLSTASRRFRQIYLGSQKLVILEEVLETEFGPMYEAVQLITHNSSQQVHHPRQPPMSMSLAKDIMRVGRVVQQWELIYPTIRWRHNTEYRRLLRDHEKYRLRTALYRKWLYDLAFHGVRFLRFDRDEPLACTKDRRLTYMRQFTNDELIELAEVNDVIHEMVLNDLCPSNAMVQRRFAQGCPDGGLLYFGSYETYPVVLHPDHPIRHKVGLKGIPATLVREAWGSYEYQRTIVSAILKLAPDQLLNFKDLANRAERLVYLDTLPLCFTEYPSTLRSAMEAVMAERDYGLGTVRFADGGIVDYFEEEEEND